MSTSFQEFLHQKAEEFGRQDRIQLRDEWVTALHRFYRQIQAWLRESDPERLLEMGISTELKFDPAIGTFEMPILTIRLGEAMIRVQPMGRKVIAGTIAELLGRKVEGRVDFMEKSSKINSYRVVDPETKEEAWYISGEIGGLTRLDQDRLEMVLRDLWS